MTFEAVLLAASAVSALLKLRSTDQYAALQADANALLGKLRADLPTNGDGTPYTDTQIHALAAQAHAAWADVALRAQTESGQ